jgi:argininosuccinate lyase
MTLVELQKFSHLITMDVFSILSLENSLANRNVLGGTARRMREDAALAQSWVATNNVI